jgi:hypothetical protein
MTQLRAGLQQEMAQKIRRRLLALATRPQDPGGGSP